MDFEFTPKQRRLQSEVRAYADERLAPHAGDWDREATLPDAAAMDGLVEMGLHGLCLPEELGGGGRPLLDAVLCVEQLARVSSLCASGVFESNMGPVQAITRYGTEQQRQRWVPPVCRGELQIGVSMTEPEAGTALTELSTRADLIDGVIRLNGRKAPTGGGGHSGAYVVYCRMGERPGAKGIAGIVVEKDTPGLSFEPYPTYLGWRGIPVSQLIFDNCEVPADHMVIEPGGFANLMNAFNIERVGNATMALGLATGALEHATRWALERKTYGHPIAERGAIQQMVADMATRVEAARLLVYRAATTADQGLAGIKETSMAKLFANETAKAVTDQALEIFGARGYTDAYPIERLLRDSRGWPIAGGTLQVQRLTIAQAVFGRRFSQRQAM
jgi:alkylation response protein AidB-like acyl-CoA dehydrogenase